MAKDEKTFENVALTGKNKKTLGSIVILQLTSFTRERGGRLEYTFAFVIQHAIQSIRRIIEINGSNRRELFNLAQARSYAKFWSARMQTAHRTRKDEHPRIVLSLEAHDWKAPAKL
jgi:hypothetical protein